MADAPLELALKWETFCLDLLDRTSKFPRSARFTFASRIDEAALDVLTLLVDARYRAGARRAQALEESNLRLSRLRVLLRLAHRRQLLSHRAYEHVSTQLDEVGRMLGGWLKQATRGRSDGGDRPPRSRIER